MQDLNSAMAKAVTARESIRKWDRSQIISLLEIIAEKLDGAASELIPLAMKETNLTEVRLTGEVGRMSGQWRHMAAVLKKGDYLGTVIDSADSTLQPPRPELRKTTVPLGVVGIFGASNFPFAFGVGGCDTASAIAAGCPVIIKAHPGHLETSRKVFQIMAAAAQSVNAPDGLFNMVEAFEAGIEFVKHKDVSAVAFTGSTLGGRALFDIAQSRKDPIPFYGELGGLNPIFVTEEAANRNGSIIAQGFLDSVNLGAGQFCTKPGYLILVNGSKMLEEIVNLVPTVVTHAMLNEKIREAHARNRSTYAGLPFVKLLAQGVATSDAIEPITIFEISGADLLANQEVTLKEVFGPTAVVVNCASNEEALKVANSFHGTLASGIHGEVNDKIISMGLLDILVRISGRIIWNSWPTGVAVTWAMHHGGPYPASTNSLFTSVGADSIKRFRRPVVFQNMPTELLPTELK